MKKFPLRDVLTVTTDRLLTKPTGDGNGIEALYELLEYLCGSPPFTHQLPEFFNAAKPWVLKNYPSLEAVSGELEALDITMGVAPKGEELGAMEAWLKLVAEKHGLPEEVELEPLPPGQFKPGDPLCDLIDKVGADRVVVVKGA